MTATTQVLRHKGVDILRVCLLPCVIFIHAHNLARVNDASPWEDILLTLCNGAVPAYFVIAGYFMKVRSESLDKIILKPVRRLLPIYLFWLFTYYTVTPLLGVVPNFQIRDIFTGGLAYHLWFLPALLVALVAVGSLERLEIPYLTWTIVLMLAAAGLAGGSYHDALDLAGPSARGGLLAAPLFAKIGLYIRQRDIFTSRRAALGFVAAAYLLNGLECSALGIASGATYTAYPFTVTAYLIGPALFVFGHSLNVHVKSQLVDQATTTTLGAYAVHLLVLAILTLLVTGRDPIAVVVIVFLTAVISIGVAVFMYRCPTLRRFVS